MYEDYTIAAQLVEHLLDTPSVTIEQSHHTNIVLQGKAYTRYDSSPLFHARLKRAIALLSIDLSQFQHIFHITGTSGKGSIANFLQNSLTKQNIASGMYTSPHISVQTERIKIGSHFIAATTYRKIVTRIIEEINPQLMKERLESLRYLQVLFLTALTAFFEAKLNTIVIEVGFGGSADYTNIFSAPKTCVISSVGWDHVEKLGPRLEDIAFNKAGIITPHSTVITAARPPALSVIQDVAKEKQATFLSYPDQFMMTTKENTIHVHINKESRDFAIPVPSDTPLYHQENIALAAVAQWQTFHNNLSIPTTKLPGRFETISHNPLFIIDGAHNLDKIHALIRTYKFQYTKKPIIIFSILETHTSKEIVSLLGNEASHVVLTQPMIKGNKVSTDPQMLASMLTETIDPSFVHVIPNVEEAVDFGMHLAGKENLPILATGSIYLIGQIRNLFISPQYVVTRKHL